MDQVEPAPGSPQARARAVFNATADRFDDLSFWELVGRRTVELAGIRPGDRVLDVCCGTGASALAAAAVVGPGGSVLGVDLADRLLDRAREKAFKRSLAWARFEVGDLLALDVADGSVDAAVCVFGIFFVPDMAAGVRELWRTLRPGGTLAITSWHGGWVFEPANRIFWDAVARQRPDLHQETPPWSRIADPDGLAALMVGAGLAAPAIADETFHYPTDPQSFWTLVLGSGYRAPLDAMGPEAADRVRAETMAGLAGASVTTVTSGVMYARSVKTTA